MTQSLELILLIALGLASAALLGYWSAVTYHIGRTMVLIPTARRGLSIEPSPDRALPTVCVIVPAHNEESCIQTIATTLVTQDYPPDLTRAVFVLDRCSDLTRERLDAVIAASGGSIRTRIIELDECPPGWIGKSHALWSGTQLAPEAATSDLLLFIDADTKLDPRLIRASISLMLDRQVSFLSLLSTLRYDHWFERLVQPAAGMELMRQYPVVKANAVGPRRRPFANGQFILVRRDDYLRIGGHKAVRDAVLEDVELARLADRNNLLCGFYLDGGMLQCRMYDSFTALRRGWKRIYGESANRKPARLRKIARRVRLIGSILPLLTIAAIVTGLLARTGSNADAASIVLLTSIPALIIWLAVIAWMHILGRIPLAWVLAFPVGSWIVGGIMHEAASDLDRRKPTVWGGIEYTRDTR